MSRRQAFKPKSITSIAFCIICPDHESPAEIVLALEQTQGQYHKTFPLRHSQQVLAETNEEDRVQLTVYHTHDLRMELLSLGDRVRVLAPASLRRPL